jgi:PAS domain S-box-containing protein
LPVAIVILISALVALGSLACYAGWLVRSLRRAEASRAFVEGVLNTIVDPIFVKDRQHRLVLVNDAECKLAGRPREGLIGKTDYDFFPKEQVDVFWRQDDVVIETGEENVNEEAITGADRVTRTIITKKARYIAAGGAPHIVGAIRDISDRKRAEDQVHKLNDELEKRVADRTEELARAYRYVNEVIDSVADPVFVKDRQHRWVLLNKAFCDYIGHVREELIGKSDYEFFPKAQADVFWANDDLVFASGEENVNEEEITDERGVVHVGVTKKVLYTDERGEKRIVGIIRDITERRRLESQLRQAQKMESVGLLAGGIAHDFNNLLTPIIGNSELLLLRNLGPDSASRLVREIKQAADRASDLTRQLLAFGRKQMLELKPTDVAAVITHFEPMLRRTIREDIRIQVILAQALGSIRADGVQIEQVLLNLSLNARDSMPNGGVLTIEAQNVELDKGYVSQHPEVKAGPYVMIAVSDTGVGMNPETLGHLFEPFFTTKEMGKGTGLGLSMVYGIVKQHRGSISVYSEPGKGTTLKIYLPRLDGANDAAARRSVAPSADVRERGGETILVVEDNDMVRSTACEMLRRLGYQVLAADSEQGCFQVSDSHDGSIDLLLTDVILSKSNGKEVYEKLRAKRTDLRVLYMSGYTSNVIVHHGVLDEGVYFIQKPLSLQLLSSKIREVLDRT